MKLSRIALAMLVAAPLAAANAGVTVTPLMVGYTFQDTGHNNGADHLLYPEQGEIQDDLVLFQFELLVLYFLFCFVSKIQKLQENLLQE